MYYCTNIVVFIVEMFINDYPKHLGDNCTLRFLGRFSFQPLKENPLFRHLSSREMVSNNIIDIDVK